MFAAEVCAEIWIGDSATIAFSPLGPRVLPIGHLSLWSSLLMPVFFPLLLLSHVLLPFSLLHLTFVLLAFRVPVSTLRLLCRPPLVLRSHFVTIAALRFLIPPVFGPGLILVILRLRVVLTFIFVLFLSPSHHRRS
jgi:hypothetical protein